MSKAPTTVETKHAAPADSRRDIELKDPAVAALLAWLIPGLGHCYQGRRSKAVLFFVCIMSTFAYGLYLGEGRVVYASWRPTDRRLPYLCQVGVGLPALPALVQAHRFRDEQLQRDVQNRRANNEARFLDWFMAPPELGFELDEIHKRLNRYFELGTVFTMIAGLLNILAIYDAWGGPAFPEQSQPARRKEEQDDEASPAPENSQVAEPSP